MVDIFVYTAGDQSGGVFKIPFRVAFGFDQEKAKSNEEYRANQADPRKNLQKRKRIEEPNCSIQENQTKNALKGQKSSKTIGMGTSQRKTQQYDRK